MDIFTKQPQLRASATVRHTTRNYPLLNNEMNTPSLAGTGGINTAGHVHATSKQLRSSIHLTMTNQPWGANSASYYYNSSHPYLNSYTLAFSNLVATGVLGYMITFSQYCNTESGVDVLTLYNFAGTQLYQNSGTVWPTSITLLTTTGFNSLFTSDAANNYWGFFFTAAPLCANGYYFNGPSASCQICGTGSYSLSGNVNPIYSCTQCSANTYADIAGN